MDKINTEARTTFTIFCKDGSKRKITVFGNRDLAFGQNLGKDLERGNYNYCLIS